MCSASEMTYIVSGGALNSTHSLTLICDNVLYYGDTIASLSIRTRKTYGTQNIQNDCHEWLS